MKIKYIIILVIVIVAATYLGIVLSEENIQETNKNLDTVANNVITNSIVNNSINNTIENNNIVNDINNTVETTTENIITDKEEKPYEEIETENKKIEKAVQIVKEHWGEDNSVVIQYDGWQHEGKYVVVVRDAQTRNTKFEFYVDIETGKYEII